MKTFLKLKMKIITKKKIIKKYKNIKNEIEISLNYLNDLIKNYNNVSFDQINSYRNENIFFSK